MNRSSPQRSNRSLGYLSFGAALLVASLAPAVGQEDTAGGDTGGGATTSSDTECSIIPDGPLDLGSTWIEWIYEGDNLTNQLEIRAADRTDTVFWLEGRIHFKSEDVFWEQGPYLIDALEEVQIEVDIPEEALFSADQADYISDMRVHLVSVNSVTEKTMERSSAPHLRVLWPDGASVQLLDAEMAELIAPGGVYLYGSAYSTTRVEEEGYVYEYGPGG